MTDLSDLEELTHDLLIRHRIDVAKMYLGKDGGYSLRKFKRIFKREMAERPQLYEILKDGKSQSGNDKQASKDINDDDLDEIEAALGEQDVDADEGEGGDDAGEDRPARKK